MKYIFLLGKYLLLTTRKNKYTIVYFVKTEVEV